MIVAAGKGERASQDIPKQYVPVAGKPMLRHSAQSLADHPMIDRIWIVIGDGQAETAKKAMSGIENYRLVTGGDTRQQSVSNGLAAITAGGGTDHILVHDAARPFLAASVIDRLLDALDAKPAAIPVLPTVDTTIRIENGLAAETLDRSGLWRVQTPQAFHFDKLVEVHQQTEKSADASDDAQLIRACGYDVAIVEGDDQLRKFTTRQDFADAALTTMIEIRTGSGFDVHRLAAGEDLWLGGLRIEHDKGLAGHSDADVLLHALTDALLGAIAAGDIGDHFPPSDEKWRGVASDVFVGHAVSLIRQKGATVHNVDMTLICEEPKIKPHREAMRSNIAAMLDIEIDRVSLKATTTERLGFTGRGEGIAAQATVTVGLK
ncbi:2-C-methyl-D-erythritol 2,4-cyclodiphosphate synthase [Parasphingorhabdus marina DSM 22363]|uniref:Bifunctional enzyme IspD/IspF n=2 Tax=Parasphingorhabdus marina TaxID=394732 RepID=A0A1N6FQX9_9SPHN|nr:2-C-methyl-D-erythritol 2,4-cyclodiphosphate synthase [Parasphingorhabdus marina DSM 22363]